MAQRGSRPIFMVRSNCNSRMTSLQSSARIRQCYESIESVASSNAGRERLPQPGAIQEIQHDIRIRVRSALRIQREECARKDMGDTSPDGDSPIELIPGVGFERIANVRSRLPRF